MLMGFGYSKGPYGPLNGFEEEELEPSACTQLDTIGMQPHSREYLEQNVNCLRSERVYRMIEGNMIDHTPGIHFGEAP